MGDKSAIEWTDATWNPVTGCDRVSAGCDHCYALALAKRMKAMGNPRYQNDGSPRTSGPGFGVTMHLDLMELPLRWKQPRLVFVNSMSDLFHPAVTEEFIEQIFRTMHHARWHRFQILTKRPRRMASLLSRLLPEPLSNVWLGTSIESNDYVSRADLLRQTPASIRFLSLEPLIGPLPDLNLTGIQWVIVGGESGSGHRPLDIAWARSLRDRCALEGVAFFFKQWGGYSAKAGGRILDGRTWDEMPTSTTLALSSPDGREGLEPASLPPVGASAPV